jgi:hypothetical protein
LICVAGTKIFSYSLFCSTITKILIRRESLPSTTSLLSTFTSIKNHLNYLSNTILHSQCFNTVEWCNIKKFYYYLPYLTSDYTRTKKYFIWDYYRHANINLRTCSRLLHIGLSTTLHCVISSSIDNNFISCYRDILPYLCNAKGLA